MSRQILDEPDQVDSTKDLVYDKSVSKNFQNKLTTAAAALQSSHEAQLTSLGAASRNFAGYAADVFKDNISKLHATASEFASEFARLATLLGDNDGAADQEQNRRKQVQDWLKHLADVEQMPEIRNPPIGTRGDNKWPTFPRDEHRANCHTCHTYPPGPTMPSPIRSKPIDYGPGHRPEPGRASGVPQGVSSADPDQLDNWVTINRGIKERLVAVADLREALVSFDSKCQWGSVFAEKLFDSYEVFCREYGQNCDWVLRVSLLFRHAGGSGQVCSLSNAALFGSLSDAGNSSSGSTDQQLDPPRYHGNPATSGYADDPVNVSSGNFIENETDLGFAGACGGLGFTRTYNSLATAVGGFGIGWASWTETGLRCDDEAARWIHPDGRHSVFPRQGSGWDRAVGESYWLTQEADQYHIIDHAGACWVFTATGQLDWFAQGAGTKIKASYRDARLVKLSHERGRSIVIEWDDDRVAAIIASDGRRINYRYDDLRRLTGAQSYLGWREYGWDDHDLMVTVTDADGVVEVSNTYDEQGRVATQLSPHGRTSRYAYLPGNTTVVSDQDGDRSNSWVSDARGRIVGIVDAAGNRQSMAYDRWGQVVMGTDRSGVVTLSEFDQRGRRIKQLSPSGASLITAYDDRDRIVRQELCADTTAVTTFEYCGDQQEPTVVIDPEGGRTTLVWCDGLLIKITDPTGVSLSFEYDDHGDLIATKNADGAVARLVRDDCGRVIQSITPRGNITSYEYNNIGLLTTRTSAAGGAWRYEYTTGARMTAIIDPMGSRTSMTYDDHGDQVCITDAMDRKVRRHIDDCGNLQGVELPDGSHWEFGYDALSRLVNVTDAHGATWKYGFSATGGLAEIIDPLGAELTVSFAAKQRSQQLGSAELSASTDYDKLGRKIRVRTALGAETTVSYDRCGRAVRYVDGQGRVATIDRDAAGRVVMLTLPGGETLRYEYDRCGRLSAVIDQLGGRSTYSYDADSQLVQQTWPTGEFSSYSYDRCGNLIIKKTPGLGVQRWTYDLANRVTATKDGLYGTRLYRYDAAGLLIATVDGNGGVTRFGYDANARMISRTDPLGGTTRRELDKMGRVIAETDPLGRLTRAGYDAVGRQLWQEDPEGHRIEWTYDHWGRVTSIITDGELTAEIERHDDNRSVTIMDYSDPDRAIRHVQTWDNHGRLIFQQRNNSITRWEYDHNGMLVGVTAPSGAITSYGRDAAARVISVKHSGLAEVAISRDAGGRIVSVCSGDRRETWTWQDGFVRTHQSSMGIDTQAGYDEEGRLTSLTQQGKTTQFGYDEAGQLTHSVTDDQVATWDYDAAGRLITETRAATTWQHEYDAAGQLIETLCGDQIITYSYDSSGRRILQVSNDGNQQEFHWTVRGTLAGIKDRNQQREQHYSLHVDALGQLSRVDNVELFWDRLNSAQGLIQVGEHSVASVGSLTAIDSQWLGSSWRQHRATSASEPWANQPGRDLGPLSVTIDGGLQIAGLEWLGARVFDSTSRAFLSPDPLAPVAGAAWAANGYAYAGNSPLNAIDPTGLSPITDHELHRYQYGEQTHDLIAAADPLADKWQYVNAGAALGAGIALMLSGIGGPIAQTLVEKYGDLLGGRVGLAFRKIVEADLLQGGVDPTTGKLTPELVTRLTTLLNPMIDTAPLANTTIGATTGSIESTLAYLNSGQPVTAAGFFDHLGEGAAAGAAQALGKGPTALQPGIGKSIGQGLLQFAAHNNPTFEHSFDVFNHQSRMILVADAIKQLPVHPPTDHAAGAAISPSWAMQPQHGAELPNTGRIFQR